MNRQAGSSSIKDPTQLMTELIAKMTSNEYGDQPTATVRQMAAADWDTHYKRQQITSWLDTYSGVQ